MLSPIKRNFHKRYTLLLQLQQREVANDTKTEAEQSRKRIDALDNNIKKPYESFAVGRITDERLTLLCRI